ncbi:MAG: hypothetical protein RLZZ292_2687 [Bacteroidota bacterium]
MNLSATHYWSAEVPFANLMLQASPWISGNSDYVLGDANTKLIDKMTFDGNGYPTEIPQTIAGIAKAQTVRTVLAWDNYGILPHGKYTLRYEGEGEVELFGLDTITILKKEAGLVEFDLKPLRQILWKEPAHFGGSLGLIIRKSLKNNRIRNIRVLLPNVKETDATYPFNPFFVEKMRPFKAIRFMNWTAAFWSAERTWSDYRPSTYYTQSNLDWSATTNRSVSYEYMVQLCNLLKSDLWLNMPYGVDSNYVYQVSKLVKNTLNSKQKIYLELGNEAWNYGEAYSKQYNYIKDNVPPILLNKDHQYRYAYHANRLFKAFESYAPTNAPKTLRVLAGQQADETVLQRSMEGFSFLNVAGQYDIGSVSDYSFTEASDLSALSAQSTVADVAKIARKSKAKSLAALQKNNDILGAAGKKMILYEGGLDISVRYPFSLDASLAPAYAPVVWAFQNDTSCYNIYTDWLRNVHALPTTELTMQFVLADRDDAHYGSYGHLQNIFTDDASNRAKYKAVLDFCGVQLATETLTENTKPINLFPNPNNGTFTILFEDETFHNVSIFNQFGKKVFQKNVFETKHLLEINDLSNGIYFVKVDGYGVKKMVVVR